VTRVFVDATTCIALGAIGELELLTRFTGELLVLLTIENEVTTEPARTNVSRFLDREAVKTTDPAVQDWIQQAKEVLDENEQNGDVSLVAAVLAYTAEGQSVGVVSDDQRVRTTTRGLGATVTGTVGVVIRAVEEGLDREEAYKLVRQIDSYGLHMTGNLRDTAYSLIDAAAEC
jgi:predicted nucleic acid-binding protein